MLVNVCSVARVRNTIERCGKKPGEIKYAVSSLAGTVLEAERSSSSGRNAVNGVITTDRRSGVCVAAPTSSRIDRKEEKRRVL